jgi:hypothetical protein
MGDPTAGLTKMRRESVQAAIREMIEESAARHLQADGLVMKSGARSECLTVTLYAQRNGQHIYTNVFSFLPRWVKDPKLEIVLAASLLYACWPERCTKLFGTGIRWERQSPDRMLKAVERALKADHALRCHSELNALAANVREVLKTLASPVDLHMLDLVGPLRSAIKKGASRDDLIRLVDEAFAESVMKS